MAIETATPQPAPKIHDPFELGWRYVRRERPDGSTYFEQVPLTPRDLLYPEEDDFVVTNELHVRNCLYLRQALTTALADRPTVRTFFDHRIDFQVEGLQPLGPDLAVIDGVPQDWDPNRGTFPVKDFAATPLAVIEVTSPSTRDGDLAAKVGLYQRASVPAYVIVDLRSRGDTEFITVMGYRLEAGKYVRVEPDVSGVLWVPDLGVGFAPAGLRVYLIDRSGVRIPEHEELELQVKQLAKDLADAEQRAEQEKQRAEQEKQRADALEAELRRLRGG